MLCPSASKLAAKFVMRLENRTRVWRGEAQHSLHRCYTMDWAYALYHRPCSCVQRDCAQVVRKLSAPLPAHAWLDGRASGGQASLGTAA
jgi:hypothetical protein